MPVGLDKPKGLGVVPGIRLASVHCGLKADRLKKDVVLIEVAEGSTTSAVFTQNRFCAAPVTLSRQHISQASPRFLLINSGNANAGSGEQGLEDASACCQSVADKTGVNAQQVLPFSTGVIGQSLNVAAIQSALPLLYEQLDENSWLEAAEGIMTTDTIAKAVSEQVLVNGKPVTITGICKGSGMIHPNMATMLAFIATDAVVGMDELQQCLNQVVEQSFNSITVDGDTSTNDSCVLIATGKSGVKVEADDSFLAALKRVFVHLAQAIIRDGEGATKFIEVRVEGAPNIQDARKVAEIIALSPLVKTAAFASDANWGRILAAIGRAPVDKLNIDRVDLSLDHVDVIKAGLPDKSYRDEIGQEVMQKDEFSIIVNLNAGDSVSRIWTTDFSYDYVRINAEYRS